MLKIGHRGAMGYQPENTLASFRQAKKMKVDVIEFDVRRCKSGELVVIHNKTVNDTTDSKGVVKQLTLEELKKMDAGNGEKIPTLAEAIYTIGPKMKINIELKDQNIAKDVCNFVKNIIKTDKFTYENFIVSSFSKREINNFIKLCPQIKTGKLVRLFFTGNIFFSKKIKTDFVIIHKYAPFKKILAKKVHRLNKKIGAYTINNKKQILFLKKNHFDAIFSNFPDRL